MSSFNDFQFEINKMKRNIITNQNMQVEEIEIDLTEEVKELIVYAKSPTEVNILVKAYADLYNLNKRCTY